MIIENLDVTEEVTALTDAEASVPLHVFIASLAAARGYSEARAWREVIIAGASRVAQLYKYNLKKKAKDSKFRPYAPLKLDAESRGDVKRAAKAAGIATPPPGADESWRCTFMTGHQHEGPIRRCLKPKHSVFEPHRF